MSTVKLIVSSKKNLLFKYGNKLSSITALLAKMQKADKANNLDTRLVFIDDATSCKAAGIKTTKTVTEASSKKAVDDLYKKLAPAYIVILGAGDVFPFQDINNPTEDEDMGVPSDLPYACDAPFGRTISAFTGPTRVVGRIPDLPGKQKDVSYFTALISNAMAHKPVKPNVYRNYFAVTAQVWKKSTEMSLQSMFSDATALIQSPAIAEKTPAQYSKKQLKPALHFYNCHGAPSDPCFYGQRRKNYPEAMRSGNLAANVTMGSVVAAECCYGAQLYDFTQIEPAQKSICHTYLENGAIAFVGSSNIAYGPADSNALADLITQYFVKNILKGASAGRAFLEARQQFLSASGPQLDPYELKTLAQFYLLGDPSVQPAINEDVSTTKIMAMNSIANSRASLFSKGVSLQNSIEASTKQTRVSKSSNEAQVSEILKTTNFDNADEEFTYNIASKNTASGLQKKLTGQDAKYRAYIKNGDDEKRFDLQVLVVKEDKDQVLGWRVYERR